MATFTVTPTDTTFTVQVGENTLAAANSATAADGFADAAAASAASIASVTDEVKIGLGTGATAVRMLEAAGSISPSVFRAFTPANATAYEFVVVARAQGNRRFLNLINVANTSRINLVFDLTTSEVQVGDSNDATGSIRDLGGGFFECTATITSTGTESSNWQARPTPSGAFPFAGDTAEGLWIKSMELRVAGTTENLFPSNDPANAAFTKSSLTATPGTVPEQRTSERVADLEVAVDALQTTVNGTMTATRMTEASGAGLSVRAFRLISIPSGNSYRLQFQAKAGERTIMRSFSQGGLGHTVSFNLATGAASGAGARMEQLFGGWWECIYEAVSTDSAGQNWQVQVAGSDGSWPYNGDGESGLLLHRARVTNLTTEAVLLDTADWETGWTLTDATVEAGAALFSGISPDDLGGLDPHPLQGKKVAILGTSLVEQNRWPAAFQSLTGCTVINLGVSGASYGLSDDYSDSRIGQASEQLDTSLIPADTALIIVDQGVNDPLWRVPVGTVTDTTTATFAGAMANVSIWAAANRPDAKVIYTQLTSAEPTYPTHRHGGLASGGLATVAELEVYQDMLARIARREGRPLIDLNDGGISWRDLSLRFDELHWNDTGGALVAEIVSAETRRLAVPGWLS